MQGKSTARGVQNHIIFLTLPKSSKLLIFENKIHKVLDTFTRA